MSERLQGSCVAFLNGYFLSLNGQLFCYVKTEILDEQHHIVIC